MIPHFSKPNITYIEIEAVVQAMEKGHLSDGVVVKQFEDSFKEVYPKHHAVAFNSGTSAMHLALLARGIGPGDEVIVTPYTFVASVNVVLAVGATPVFADIDRDSYNMDPQSVHDVASAKTTAVIPVDVFGAPCDIRDIRWATPANTFVLEDAIEAIGSLYEGQPIGLYADAFAFGFFPNKQMTTCEGGILLTEDRHLATACRRLVAHGAAPGDKVYQGWGLNQRLSDVHAAMGLAQLSRIVEMQEELRRVERLLDTYFEPYKRQTLAQSDKATIFIYSIELPEGVDKVRVCTQLQKLGVPVKPYFNNLLDLPHLKQYDKGQCPVAAEVAARTIALPMFPGQTQAHVDEIYAAFKKVVP